QVGNPTPRHTEVAELLARIAADQRHAFDPEVLDAAADLHEQDPPAFAEFAAGLRRFKVPLRLWNAEQKKRAEHRRKIWLEQKRAVKPDPLLDPDDRITIEVDTNEPRVVDEALSALAGRDDLYQRAGQLVHIVRDASKLAGIVRPPGSPRIVPATLPRL